MEHGSGEHLGTALAHAWLMTLRMHRTHENLICTNLATTLMTMTRQPVQQATKTNRLEA